MSGLRTVLHASVLALIALFSIEQSEYSYEKNQFRSEFESIHSLGEYFSGFTILTPTISNSFFGSKNFSPATTAIRESTLKALWISIPVQFTGANHSINIRLLKVIYPFHSFW